MCEGVEKWCGEVIDVLLIEAVEGVVDGGEGKEGSRPLPERGP